MKPVSDGDATYLGVMGSRLIALGVVAGLGIAWVWLLGDTGSAADQVATVAAIGLAVLPLVLARRHRAALDWARGYPSRVYADQQTPIDGDPGVDRLLDLDEATAQRLRKVQHFDLGLLFALAPGFVLLARFGLGAPPLSAGLGLLREVFTYGVLWVVVLIAVANGWWVHLRPGTATRIANVVWVLLVAACGAWAVNVTFDAAPGTTYRTTFAGGYHCERCERSYDGTDTGIDVERLIPPPPLHLSAFAAAPEGLVVHDPDWTEDHHRGDPVRLSVRPGALGVAWIAALGAPRKARPKPAPAQPAPPDGGPRGAGAPPGSSSSPGSR